MDLRRISMNAVSWITVFAFNALVVGSFVHAADDTLSDSTRTIMIETGGTTASKFELALVDGDIGFLGFALGKPGHDAPLLPGDRGHPRVANRFVNERGAFRAFVTNKERRLSREQGEKHGWYLAGDYSSNPARVILTKEPAKYSRWTFVRTERRYSSEGYYAYIKNENDRGKEGWLSMEARGKVYKDGWEFLRPILSGVKTEFVVIEQPSK
jgi:hypothetical protein